MGKMPEDSFGWGSRCHIDWTTLWKKSGATARRASQQRKKVWTIKISLQLRTGTKWTSTTRTGRDTPGFRSPERSFRRRPFRGTEFRSSRNIPAAARHCASTKSAGLVSVRKAFEFVGIPEDDARGPTPSRLAASPVARPAPVGIRHQQAIRRSWKTNCSRIREHRHFREHRQARFPLLAVQPVFTSEPCSRTLLNLVFECFEI